MNAKVSKIALLILWLLFLQITVCPLAPLSPPSEAQVSARPLALSGLIIAGRLVQQIDKGGIRIIRKGQSLSPVYAGMPIDRGDQITPRKMPRP